MALPKPTDEAGSILYDQRGQRVAVEPPIEPTADATPVAIAQAEANAPPEQQASILDTEAAPAVVLDKPVQVAGLIDKLTSAFARRAAEAEKRVLPPLPDKPVQMIGNQLLVRGLEQDEIDRLSQVLPGYTKGINFPKIANDIGENGLADHLQQLKNANADLFEQARRGTLNFEALLAKADAKGADAYLIEWAKQGGIKGALPEDQLGGVLAAVQLTKETKAQNAAAMAMPVGPERDAALKRWSQMAAMEGQVYANLSGMASEAGRTLFVLSQSAKMGGANVAGRAAELRNLFGANSAQDLELLGQAYMSLPAGPRAEFARQGWLAKSMDVIAEVYINSLLSSPVTHAVNIVGNSVFMMSRMAETAMAGAIGGVRSRITGNADRVYMRESQAQMHGVIEGFVDALAVAGKTLITEEAPLTAGGMADLSSKMEMSRRAIGTSGDPRVIYEEFRNGNWMAGAVNVVGTSVRMPGRFLLAEDQFFKGVGYRMHIRGEAEARAGRIFDQASEAGKTPQEALALAEIERQRILTSPPQNVVENAQAAAKEMTFQKDLEGPLAGAGQFLAHPAAKLFVPFFKTPTNIMLATFERSPLQLANPGFYKTLQAGGREADIAMSKVAVGSMIMGTFAYGAMGLVGDDVRINGAGPSDRQAQDAWKREGFIPYSISSRNKDGTWTSYTYSRMDPLSGLLAMAADYAYYAQHEGNGSVLEDLSKAAVMSLSNYMLDQPLLQGVNELSAALFRSNDPEERYKAIMKWVGENPSSAVMSALPGNSAIGGAITRYQNPDRANTMLPEFGILGDDPTQAHPIVQGFYIALQKAKAQNPYFNASLPPALNEWGERIPASNGSAWEFINPIKIRDTKYSPVDVEIQRLGGGMSPTPKKIDGVDLNAKQFNRLIELANTVDANGKKPGDDGYRADRTMLPILSEVIASPAYQALPSKADQQDALSNVVSSFRKMSRQYLFQEDPYLKAKIDARE